MKKTQSPQFPVTLINTQQQENERKTQHYCSITGLFSLFFAHCGLKFLLPHPLLFLRSQVLERDEESNVSPVSPATANQKKSSALAGSEKLSPLHNYCRGGPGFCFVLPPLYSTFSSDKPETFTALAPCELPSRNPAAWHIAY